MKLKNNGDKSNNSDGNDKEGNNDGRKSNDDGGTASGTTRSKDSGILKIVKEPWFIAAVGGFLCAVICVFVIVIKCRRWKRKRPSYFAQQSNGKKFLSGTVSLRCNESTVIDNMF